MKEGIKLHISRIDYVTIRSGLKYLIGARNVDFSAAGFVWKPIATVWTRTGHLDRLLTLLWSIKLKDCGDVDNYASRIDRKVKDYNLCAGPTTPSTTDTDAADTDSAKTIAKMSEQEHIFCLLRGIPRNNKWKVFLELMMDKNATMTATPNEIVTMLVEKEAAIKRENGLAPEAPLFAKKGGKGGGNGGKAGKGGKSPRRDWRDDKRDNKDDRKEKDFRKGFNCQR
jgi:hypothetical protein